MKVSIFALGRTGLPLSLVCADSGFDVIGIDINEELVQQIKNGELPFYEPGMKELLDKHLNKKFFPTTEIIEESAKVSAECKDRIPEALKALESDNKVTKRLSKEKKGYVWTLVS